MTCSCCGAPLTVQRTKFCARCLFTAVDAGAEGAVLEGAEEAPPCELLSIIGDSARAITFLGEQTWPVRRLVAFKLSKDHLWTGDAGTGPGVPRHPSIAPVLESGRLGQRQYVMTEYFGGGELPKCYDRHRLNAASRLDALLDIADAIAVTHTSGMVHGSLTAPNLVCEPGPAFRVRLVDFDGAGALSRAEATFERLTRADLDGILTMADTLLQSPVGQVPTSIDLPAELRRLRMSAQSARDLHQALAALAAKLPGGRL